MRLDHFFYAHPVFTVADLDVFLNANGSHNRGTRQALLRYHRTRGHIVSIRRGLYSAVPPGTDPIRNIVDPYLVGAKTAPDAVLAYHTALGMHGVAHSFRQETLILTRQGIRKAPVFQGHIYRSLRPPEALGEGGLVVGVESAERMGLDVRVTGLERTVVDVLDRPALGGGWEEIWRSLESVGYLNLDQVVNYTGRLKNATTAAKVGYYLEANCERLMVDDRHLAMLRQQRPRSLHYLDRRRSPGRLIAGWNLVVPHSVAEHAWDELQ